MTRWILGATVALAVAFAPSAQAETTIFEPPAAHFPYQGWVSRAQVPTPDISLAVIETAAPNGCPDRMLDYLACTAPWEETVWLAPEAIAGENARMTFYHELGHNVDHWVLPEWARLRFMRSMKLAGPWVTEGEPKPVDSPDEVFADVWAECAWRAKVPTGPQLGFGPILQSQPIAGAVRHNRLCQMLSRLGP